MRFVVQLALAQLRHHAGRWTLMALGVALVVAVPVVTAGMTRTVSAQTVRHTIAGLDLSDRTLLVSQEADAQLSEGTPQKGDAEVRRQLARVTGRPVLRELLFRPLRVKGVLMSLGGVDALPTATALVSGRLPATCTPTRCETVVVGAGDSARLRQALASIGVVVVGRVRRTNPLLVSGQLDPGGVPLVLADGADRMAALASLELFGRHYAWVAAVDPDRVIALGVDAYVARNRDVEQTIYAKVGGTSYSRPDQQLQFAQNRANTSADRFGLLGGFAAVLLLGFAVVAAIGLRREATLLQSVLRRRGATTRQVVALHAVEAVSVAVVGTLLGAVIGGLAAANRNDGTGLSNLAAAREAITGATGTAGLLALTTAVVVAAVLLWPDAQARAVWRLLDLVMVACFAAAVLAGNRGTSQSVSGDPLIVALPVLAAIVAGLLAARLWAPIARLAERLLPRRSIAGRIGLLGALRRPLRPVATIAFLTAAIAAVLFAGAYRATLLANDADQAAYQVPLDATVTGVDTPPAGGIPVLRTNASVTQLPGVVTSVTVVAVDHDVLPRIHRWGRTTGAADDAATIARRLAVPLPTGEPTVPAGTRRLAITAAGVDPQTALALYLRSDTGRSVTVTLTGHAGTLVGTVPASGRLTVTAFSVDESGDYATHHAHAVGEGPADHELLSGRLTLGAVQADGHPLPWSWTAWGSALGRAAASPTALTLGYRINGAPVVAAPGFAQERSIAVPIVTDAQTAALAQNGLLTIKIDDSTAVTTRVVGTMPRLPTQGSPFILVDRRVLDAAVDPYAPGANATEYWFDGHPKIAGATYRQTIQDGLDADPVGRGARQLLIIVAVLALAVAALALALLVVGERRDGAGELYAWEADGTRPGVLRRALVVRAVAIALVAVPIGVLAGLVVADAGATLVAVDAAGTTPTPPLEVTLGSLWTPLVLLGGVGAGLLASIAVALGALRERFPVPAEAELR